MKWFAVLITLALALGSGSATAAARRRPGGHAGAGPLGTARPVRDLVSLRQRIQAGAAAPLPDPSGGFWVNDLVNRSFNLVPVDLRLSTAHADWYVERGYEAGDLSAAADFFEQRAFPR